MGWEHAKLGISKYQNPFESPNPLSHQLTGASLWLKGWEKVQNKQIEPIDDGFDFLDIERIT